MSLTTMTTEGISWIKDPIRDVLESMIFDSLCEVYCGTIQCKDFCSGGFCIKMTQPPD